MTAPPSARVASLFFAAVATLFASACASPGLLANRVDVAGQSYDAQECVENALRHRPDPDLLRDAETTFNRSCLAGEAGACSVLGVMYETGMGVGTDRDRAASFYESACQAHNMRACGNLGALMLQDRSGANEPWRAVVLLRTACGGGDGHACERIGRAYRDGENGPVEGSSAASFFETGCEKGDAQSCAELADDIAARGGEVTSVDRVPLLLAQACVGGYADACARVGAQRRSTNEVRMAALP